MAQTQQGILAPIPTLGRHLFFEPRPDTDPRGALRTLASLVEGERTVVGFGQSLTLALEREITGLRTFPPMTGPGIALPSTPAAIWCWLRGEDRGELLHRGRAIEKAIAASFRLSQAVDTFKHGAGLDLTGYEDGTENPESEAARDAAVVKDAGPGLDGGSLVAVQTWRHDFQRFESMSEQDQDNAIGRRRCDNEELDDAPESAHVKRTAQESFDPEAFVLRRSMPWANQRGQGGLLFVAFGKSFDAFEAQLRRMIGAEDGIQDALFRFTQPVSGGYFWCPPVQDAHLDLRALEL